MKKTKIFLPLFLGIILMISLFTVSPVSAVSYYNHLQNPSFLSYSNYIEDGGFESGLWLQGSEYGDWNRTTDDVSISTDAEYTGIYGVETVYTELSFYYNLTYSGVVLGADIILATFWAKYYYSDFTVEVTVLYSDSSSDINTYVLGSSFALVDYTSIIDDAKYVKNIDFDGSLASGSNGAYFDDFVLLVDDGGGQDDITEHTEPWIFASIAPVINGGLNTTYGRLDNTSAYTGYSNSLVPLQQSIEYLDTNYLHFIDLYASSDYGSDIGITILVFLSDGTSASKTMTIEANGSWEYLNFGVSFVPDDNSITSIHINLDAKYETYVHFDDIGVWATVAFGYTRFGFSIVPSPISKTSFNFVAHQNIPYTMNCYLYDENGTLTESGDFQFLDNTGFTTGSFEDGTFSYVLTARLSVSAFTEQITVTVILTEEVLVFQISASWYSLDVAPDVTPITPTETSNFMFLFIFIVIPSMFFSVILKSVGIPIIGFLSGLTIMSAIGRMVGIIDLWFLFVMVLVCILIILAMMKRGIYT